MWLGWLYVTANNMDQKFKEGKVLLQRSLLSRARPRIVGAGSGSDMEAGAQHGGLLLPCIPGQMLRRQAAGLLWMTT